MINNSIDATLQDATMQRLEVFIQQIHGDLPFLISLTPDERQALQSVSDGRLPYLLKCLEYCLAYREQIGMTVEDLAELQACVKLFEQLSELLALTEDIFVGLRDTQMQVGANFYRLSRGAHAQMRSAHLKGRSGMEWIIKEMDKLFANQGKPKGGGAAPTTPGPSTSPTSGQPGANA